MHIVYPRYHLSTPRLIDVTNFWKWPLFRTFIAILVVTCGCAQSELSSGGSDKDASGEDILQPDIGGADAHIEDDSGPGGADASGPGLDGGSADGSDPADISGSMEYEACVPGASGPWSSCVSQDTLDFGVLATGQLATRLVRVENSGTESISLKEARLGDPAFTVVAQRYSRGTPAQGSEASLPAAVDAGEAIFVEVSVTGSGQDAAFQADTLELDLRMGSSQQETLVFALEGSHGSCSRGTASCDGTTATGCETDINTVDNCGGCGIVCEFENASAQCTEGACEFGACEGSFMNCDGDVSTGCEVDTNSDPDNCGGCGVQCESPNAEATCEDGVCVFGGCAPGTVDLNGDPSDGCECVISDENDIPDPDGTDTNCDGISGDINRALFVAKTGDDAAQGTIDEPLKTIGEALSRIGSLSGLDHIYVGTGKYEEQLELINGISIFGGYDPADGWSRTTNDWTEIHAPAASGERLIGVKGEGITEKTYLGKLKITTANVSGNSQDTYALYCKDCPALVVRHSNVRAGNAGDGADGSNGESGDSKYGRGGAGGRGGDGDGDGPNYGPGGAAGSSGCGRTGGAGGRGGLRGENPGIGGSAGKNNAPGGAGGAGDYGFWGATGEDGKPGTNGPAAAATIHGSGGSQGSVHSDFWRGEAGADGEDGSHGNGGGGGGGGGGQAVGNSSWNGSGNGGGGGGGGGCGGTGGTGGGAGGSSFGIFLVNSTGAVLLNNLIQSGNGGKGGRGGSGGAGSAGASGGSGGQKDTSDVGAGGKGGNGSKGADGGHGGGGAGGNSYALYRQGTDLSSSSAGNTFQPGGIGSGGSSPGNSGENGVRREQ